MIGGQSLPCSHGLLGGDKQSPCASLVMSLLSVLGGSFYFRQSISLAGQSGKAQTVRTPNVLSVPECFLRSAPSCTRPPLPDNNPALTALESVQDEESSCPPTSPGDTVVARQTSINDSVTRATLHHPQRKPPLVHRANFTHPAHL
jgi:hypothetical protein